MTLADAKILLMKACDADDVSSSSFRYAIEALPDRERLDQLDPLVRGLIETRLYQLVTMEVVS